jgi:hypothetical protein
MVACAGALSGCVTNESLRAQLERRAAYDLRCEQLQLTPLEERGTTIASYGVAGCGQRATYVLQRSTGTWVMNVITGPPEQDTKLAPASVPVRGPAEPYKSEPAVDER